MATVKELRKLAKAYNIKGYSKMRKSELEDAINDFEIAVERGCDLAPVEHPQPQPKKNARTEA